MKIVIVGGVAGGAGAAARARRLDESAEIIVIERGADPSFANCGMPYYIGGEITSRDKLLVAPVALLRDRLNLDVRVREEVVSIDRTRKLVMVRRIEGGDAYEQSYDKLILATGAAPIRPPIPGIDSLRVHSLRSLADADRILAAARETRRAVVVGGGFIGVEVAENLVHRGIATTLVERGDQVLGPWDPEMVAPFAQNLRDKGIEILLGDEVIAIHDSQTAAGVELKNGAQIDAELVILAIGVRPDSRLASEAGLATGERGGIVVSPSMQTSDPDIYAVGDAVEIEHFITKSPTQVPLAGPANRQGRIAADHLFGRPAEYRGTQGTAVIGAFGRTAAMTGLTEKACIAADIRYAKVYTHPAHHAGYYPGAESMSLKLLFDPGDGRLLGAQAVGGQGVDKQIDMLATALQAGMTVFDLEELELCYAPQYGSAKAPVNMLGFVAAGVMRGDQPVVHVEDLEQLASDATLIDVRSPKEFANGAVPGAINLPIEKLRGHFTSEGELPEAPRNRAVVCYCQVGMRGYLATRILLQQGYHAMNLSGGYTTFQQHQMAKTPPETAAAN